MPIICDFGLDNHNIVHSNKTTLNYITCKLLRKHTKQMEGSYVSGGVAVTKFQRGLARPARPSVCMQQDSGTDKELMASSFNPDTVNSRHCTCD